MEKNTITINRRVASYLKKVEVSGDIIVPDVKPDILSIINVNGNSYVYREEITEGKVRLDGNLDTYSIYLSDSGETRSIQYTFNFSENFEDRQIDSNCFIRSKVYIENIEAKLLNERKISISSILKIQCEILKREEIEIGIDLNEMDGANALQKLEETVNTKSLIGRNKVKTNIKEDISIDPMYEVAEILKTSVTVNNMENKISFNKVLAKADANVKILFLSEDGKIGKAEATIPIMSFIDLEGVKEEHECVVEYSIRNMLFKINSKEMHSISCQIDFEVSLEVYETKSLDILQDIYGIRKIVEFNKKSILVPVATDCPSEKINISERILVEDILNIYDVESNVIILNNTQNSIECEVNLKIYYEADNRSGLNSKEVKIPFIVKTNNFNTDTNETNVNFQIINEQYTISGENVDFSMQVICTPNNVQNKEINLIEDLLIKDLEQDEDYKMYMYFVKEGDTIWKIAKKFKVCMEDIIQLNELENPDKINIGDRIFIMR